MESEFLEEIKLDPQPCFRGPKDHVSYVNIEDSRATFRLDIWGSI